MKTPHEFVTHIQARLADVSARSGAIRHDAVVLTLEVIDYAKQMEMGPAGDERDAFIAALANLQRALTELGAIPPIQAPHG
jgi:hypothetical protein